MIKKFSKYIAVIFLSIFLCAPLPAFASQTYLNDGANLLDESEAEEVETALSDASSKYDFVIAVVTTDSLGGKSAMEYADDYYDETYGNSTDGCVLLVSMEDRDYWISTAAGGITKITDSGIDYLEDNFVYLLSGGDYAGAFKKYSGEVEYLLNYYNEEGIAYDSYSGNQSESEFNFTMWIGIALLIGLIISLVILLNMRSKMKSVRFNDSARSYVDNASLILTRNVDVFVNKTITKVLIQSDNDGGGSSVHMGSGGFHGGGGGKF
jgi:uncharacterized protein